MKNQENMTSSKDYNSLPGTNTKDMAMYDLAVKEIKIGVLWKLNELQENREISEKKEKRNMYSDRCVNYMGESFHSVCIYILNHHDVHCKCLTILYDSYTSVKLNFKKNNLKQKHRKMATQNRRNNA